MTAPILRVINSQSMLINPNLNTDLNGNVQGSILLDKIDESQGNTEGYAQKARQKLYVPWSNPIDPTVRGYVDLVQTDNVQLANGPHGVITGLIARGKVTSFTHTMAQVATPTTASAVYAAGPTTTTITGTTYLSLVPDNTYITLTNLAGAQQVFSSGTLLAALLLVTTQIQTMYNLHISNAGPHVIHTAPDTINVVAGAATDLASAIAQLNLLATAYEAHRVLVGAGPVHTGADAANALAAPPASSLATAVVLADDLKAKFNAHRMQGILVHPLDDTWNIVTLSNSHSFTITDTSIVILNANVTIGAPVAPGWTVHVMANSKLSLNHFGILAPEIVV